MEKAPLHFPKSVIVQLFCIFIYKETDGKSTYNEVSKMLKGLLFNSGNDPEEQHTENFSPRKPTHLDQLLASSENPFSEENKKRVDLIMPEAEVRSDVLDSQFAQLREMELTIENKE